MSELKHKIEALLFASGKGLLLDDICDYCEEKPAKVKKALEALSQEFQDRDGSLAVEEHSSRWKMSVIGKYTDYVKKIVSETELPGPILKTLAVIAYKSPVLQADVIHMRGQGAYDHIKQLVKQKFVTKDEEGRSYILKITDKFFNYFDVEGDQEIREIFQSLKEKEEETRAQIEEEHAQQQKLGELDVVESEAREGDHEGIFDQSKLAPQMKVQTEEEKEEESKFLSSMDEKINQIASRLDEHTLPEKITSEEGEESSTESDEEEVSEEEKQVPDKGEESSENEPVQDEAEEEETYL